MAAIDTQIQIKQGNQVGLRQSKDLEVQFKAIGIGTSNLQVKETAGVLELEAKLKIQDGTEPGEVVTKGQLDSATGTVLTDVEALETRMDTAEADIDALEGRATAAEGRLDTAESDIDASEAAIVALDGRLDTAEADIVALDGRLDTAEATIVTHTGEISALDIRLDTAEGEIDQLQADLSTIEANTPDEEEFTSDGVTTTFDLASIVVDADNLVRDIEVFVDGRREMQATSGIFSGNKGWRKNSTSQIELAAAVLLGKVITVWKQGTAVVVSGGGGTDLQNITVHPQPSTNGGKALGTVTKAWEAVYLKDTASAQVWKLQVNGGVLEAITVP